jgi:hypothetical protein
MRLTYCRRGEDPVEPLRVSAVSPNKDNLYKEKALDNESMNTSEDGPTACAYTLYCTVHLNKHAYIPNFERVQSCAMFLGEMGEGVWYVLTKYVNKNNNGKKF